jgi:hypothetical protein
MLGGTNKMALHQILMHRQSDAYLSIPSSRPCQSLLHVRRVLVNPFFLSLAGRKPRIPDLKSGGYTAIATSRDPKPLYYNSA